MRDTKVELSELVADRKARVKIKTEHVTTRTGHVGLATWVYVELELKWGPFWTQADRRNAPVMSHHTSLDTADILLNHMIEDIKYVYGTGLDTLTRNR